MNLKCITFKPNQNKTKNPDRKKEKKKKKKERKKNRDDRLRKEIKMWGHSDLPSTVYPNRGKYCAL